MTRKQAARIRAGIVAANEGYLPFAGALADRAWFRRMYQLVERQEAERVKAYRRRSAPYSE